MEERRSGFSIRGGREPIFHGGVGVAPISLQPGEQVIRTAHATFVGRNVGGTAILTNLRFIFEPISRVEQELRAFRVILPLGEITELGLHRPPLGGSPMLRVGKKWHEGEYYMPDPALWVQDIEGLRAGTGPVPPAPPPPGVAASRGMASGIACPVCGSETLRQGDGSLVCPKCAPAAPSDVPDDSSGAG